MVCGALTVNGVWPNTPGVSFNVSYLLDGLIDLLLDIAIHEPRLAFSIDFWLAPYPQKTIAHFLLAKESEVSYIASQRLRQRLGLLFQAMERNNKAQNEVPLTQLGQAFAAWSDHKDEGSPQLTFYPHVLLWAAVEHGSFAMLETFLHLPNASYQLRHPHTNETLLHCAARAGNVTFVEQWYQQRREEGMVYPHRHETPLHLAVQNLNLLGLDENQRNKLIMAFLTHAPIALLTTRDKKGYTVLHHAVATGSLKSVITILQFIDDIVVNKDKDATKAAAAYKLLKSQTKEGSTALHLAVQAGNSENANTILKELLQRMVGAKLDLNRVDKTQRTALHYARGNQINLLMEAGALLYYFDMNGKMPLDTLSPTDRQALLTKTCDDAVSKNLTNQVQWLSGFEQDFEEVIPLVASVPSDSEALGDAKDKVLEAVLPRIERCITAEEFVMLLQYLCIRGIVQFLRRERSPLAGGYERFHIAGRTDSMDILNLQLKYWVGEHITLPRLRNPGSATVIEPVVYTYQRGRIHLLPQSASMNTMTKIENGEAYIAEFEAIHQEHKRLLDEHHKKTSDTKILKV